VQEQVNTPKMGQCMTENNTPGGKRFDTGAELKRIRGDRSQQEFADLLGVGRNTIARYESNERTPDADFLFKINLLFGVDPSRLILGREPVSLIGQRETQLLNNFRAASDEDKAAIERMAELAAQSGKIRKPDEV
jgi:transcriptional regulator with XRE-family HTH domain